MIGRPREWKATKDVRPAEGVVVETMIADELGVRNVANLKRSGNLWFFPDGSMYVYYTPTHWRES
jgi:hypothetical protein